MMDIYTWLDLETDDDFFFFFFFWVKSIVSDYNNIF